MKENPMIAVPRAAARSFRAVALKCRAGRPRGPAPVATLTRCRGAVTLDATVEGVGLTLPLDTDASPDEALSVPLAALAEAGGGSGTVEFAWTDRGRIVARWSDRSGPREAAFDAPAVGPAAGPATHPDSWSPPQPRLLSALAACARSAARESVRYALDRVQLRGRSGEAVGTDGRAALIAGGLTFPFDDDVLVPALPAFGSKDLAAAGAARIGMAGAFVVVETGPWTLRLPVRPGRYPDVAAIVPRGPAAVVGIDDRDADALLAALPSLPGGNDDGRPVTVDAAGGTAAVRAGGDGRVTEVRLSRSAVTGPDERVALDRSLVARALTLGCRTARLPGGNKPAVFEGGGFTMLVAPLDAGLDVPPTPSATATPADPITPARPDPEPRTRRADPMKTDPTMTADPPTGGSDPLVEAEALRTTLADAAARAARLVAALRHRRRERRALSQAWSSLKSLNLTPE
jgi:hypothetical protein